MRRSPWWSPVSGGPLAADTPHSLVDAGGHRWPVIDGIPYLRTGRETLVEECLARLDCGDPDGALVALLGDQDDWWTGPRPSGDDLRTLVRERNTLTLRDAMALLAFGRVGDYFAHRWSDPTFLGGLALIEAHWRPAGSAFELACGIGHFGRELLRRGVAYTGADVVFAKLWLARWWVLGSRARLVCFDAARPWPFAEERFDLVLCQDAFYFFESKRFVLDGLRRRLSPEGWLAVGHIHNRDAANLSAGAGVTSAELAAFFPDGIFYEDAELTRALVEARTPGSVPIHALESPEAFAVAAGPGLRKAPRVLDGGFAMPPEDVRLRLNPLYRNLPQHPHSERPWQKAWEMTRVSGTDFAQAPSSFDSGPAAPAQDEGFVMRPAAPAQDEGFVMRPAAPAQDESLWVVEWPSDRYRAEYEPLATYPARFSWPADPAGMAEAIRRRAFVDLPERW